MGSGRALCAQKSKFGRGEPAPEVIHLAGQPAAPRIERGVIGTRRGGLALQAGRHRRQRACRAPSTAARNAAAACSWPVSRCCSTATWIPQPPMFPLQVSAPSLHEFMPPDSEGDAPQRGGAACPPPPPFRRPSQRGPSEANAQIRSMSGLPKRRQKALATHGLRAGGGVSWRSLVISRVECYTSKWAC